MDAIKGCGVPSVRTTVQKTPSLMREGVCGRDIAIEVYTSTRVPWYQNWYGPYVHTVPNLVPWTLSTRVPWPSHGIVQYTYHGPFGTMVMLCHNFLIGNLATMVARAS
jgi:hypothetical protein